ncbi:MAG: ArnT family glycosyltransferase [Odoribacter splanchnicus]
MKYLSIADEALREGHWFTFWNHGALYADKLLFTSGLSLGKWLLDTHSMFSRDCFPDPGLVDLFIMDKCKHSLPSDLQVTANSCLTSGLFTGSAIVLRMDMLMSLFIILSLYTFYRIYTGRCSPADPIKLPIYIFLAIFTKGPVGLIIPLLTIPAFLLVKKQFKTIGKYLGWKQWSILIGLCSLWFIAVYLEGGKTYLNNLLFHQTINRAVDSFRHKEPSGII